jgi:toxin FitB
MFLLDTNVISELRKTKPHGAVLEWFAGVDSKHLYVSAVTLGEIQIGIEITRDQDLAKAQELDQWLARVTAAHNVLPMDAACFREWARLMHRKSETLAVDAMIASTAKVHGLTMVTRNIGDFKVFGVPLFNPFRNAP